jgi:hypothetical protein
MTDSPFVQRMKQLDQARQAATSLSEKVRIGEEIAALLKANHLGEPIEIPTLPSDFKLAQAGDREPGEDDA